MEINDEILGYRVQGTADWRRRKAKEFPNDHRNEEAAAALDRLAKQIDKLDGSDVHRRIEALMELAADTDSFFIYERLDEMVSAELRAVGFYSQPSGVEFLEWYYEEFKELLEDHVNDADDGVAAPDLVAQVENDEAVKAAKRAYEETYAKAYAEARKRL
jgi:hypothetical protein